MVHGVYTSTPYSERPRVTYHAPDMTVPEATALMHLIIQTKLEAQRVADARSDLSMPGASVKVRRRKQQSYESRLATIELQQQSITQQLERLETQKHEAFKGFKHLLAQEEVDRKRAAEQAAQQRHEQQHEQEEEERQRLLHPLPLFQPPSQPQLQLPPQQYPPPQQEQQQQPSYQSPLPVRPRPTPSMPHPDAYGAMPDTSHSGLFGNPSAPVLSAPLAPSGDALSRKRARSKSPVDMPSATITSARVGLLGPRMATRRADNWATVSLCWKACQKPFYRSPNLCLFPYAGIIAGAQNTSV